MSHYGPSPTGSGTGMAFPRGAPSFRPPPQAFPRGGPPPFRPPFAARGPPPFAGGAGMFRGPPPAFQARGAPPRLGVVPGLMPPPMAMMNMRPPMLAGGGFRPPPTSGIALPPGWSEYVTPEGTKYYYNAATGVSTYDLPPQTPGAVEPSAMKWVEYKDDSTGAFYYYNTATKTTVWDQPEEFRMQKAREEVAKMTSGALNAAPAAQQQQVQVPVHPVAQTVVAAPAQAEEQDEEDEEEVKRKEAQELARKKKREELEREQAAQFKDMPRAERVAVFKQFLEEKQIAPTLKWGDAQRAITKEAALHSDPRWKFALTTVGEKKQTFAEYCTQAVNRATIEKRRLVKKAREDFVELLTLFESSLAPPSRRRQASWDDVAEGDAFYALRKDPRWSAIGETRERQQLFSTFLQNLERTQKARLAKRREALHSGFMELIRQRVESKQLNFGGGRSGSSKRLDSDEKRHVLELLEQVKLPSETDAVGEDALQVVDRHEVYDWTEEYLRERRELEHARRKRERLERAERQEKLERELNERFQELAGLQELTAGSTWNEFSALHLKRANADADEAQVSKSEKDAGVEEEEEEEACDGVDDEGLTWKTQRHLFEKFVRRLRRDLEPAASAIGAHLARSGEPPLRVTETTSFAVFADALESGVGVALDNKALEEGEEEPTVGEEAKLVKVETEPSHENGDVATGGKAQEKKLKPHEIEEALERVVQHHRESKSDATTVEFPAFVRQAYDMWVAVAKEEEEKKEKRSKRHKRSRKESRELGPEDEEDEDRPRRSRRRSSAADELEEESKHRKHPSRRSSRKRRRSHGSLSASRSRSRSESRRDSSSRRRSRHKRSRSRSRSRSRDREGALPPTLATTNAVVDPALDTLAASDIAEPSPLKQPRAELSEADEAAIAEEVIRQARLKLQEKQKSCSDDSELEEGEEVEEGEEMEG